MRRFAALILTSVCAASAVQAQETRLFQNSWFWGVHAGSTSLGTASGGTGHAATIGGDWMITRTTGGIYASYDQANFTRTGQVTDVSGSSGVRNVRIHDMRTASIAGVAFPKQFGNFRPYAGLGLSIAVIGDATPLADPVTQAGQTSVTVSSDVQQRIDDARSHAGVFLIGGGQWQLRKVAVFGQISLAPSSDEFLLTNAVNNISVGVRYNFGSSIDK